MSYWEYIEAIKDWDQILEKEIEHWERMNWIVPSSTQQYV